MLGSPIALAKWVAAAVLALIIAVTPVAADTFLFHASMSGRQTLDQGADGGNPFASALIAFG